MQAQVDIQRRINRVYHALSVIRTEAVTPSIPISNGRVEFDVRCGGDASAAQMEFEAQAAIGEVASLKDHVKKRLGTAFVEDTFYRQSLAAGIVHDLWNHDKHGPGARHSKTKLDPRLLNLRRGWFGGPLVVGRVTGSLTITQDGKPVSTGAITLSLGPAAFEGVDALVVSGGGEPLGTLQALLHQALSAWEELLVQQGVLARDESSS
jgi:hypothetical protein